MAIGVYFPESDFTSKQYDEAIKKLQAAGASAPKGRQYHVAFGDPEKLQIFDVWESEDAFAKFGETLMPILGGLGYTPPEPMIAPIKNIIKG
ncbi:MAG: hypothetical protein ABI559_08565 [Chloroflexota bacterium]